MEEIDARAKTGLTGRIDHTETRNDGGLTTALFERHTDSSKVSPEHTFFY